MCGRYALKKSWAQLKAEFPWMLDEDEYFDIHGYKKRPEVFPGEFILAINKDHKREEIFWTIEDHDTRVINARAETVHKKEMFREAFAHDRVLIPATGLYEWQVQPNKKKKRFEMTFDEDLFAFAGIARDCYVKG
jgi:putative SOS response-associated peptidase YedK